jgi:hypothetical protein
MTARCSRCKAAPCAGSHRWCKPCRAENMRAWRKRQRSAEQERADVVVWLRGLLLIPSHEDNHAVFQRIAEAVERGEHVGVCPVEHSANPSKQKQKHGADGGA